MKIKLYKDLCEALGDEFLNKYGIQKYNQVWRSYETVDLAQCTQLQLDDLEGKVLKYKGKSVVGVDSALRNIAVWRETISGKHSEIKLKTAEQFSKILILTLKGVDGQRVFEQDLQRGVDLCYYVPDIRYYEGKWYHGSYTPPHVEMGMVHTALGKTRKKHIIFWERDEDDRRNKDKSIKGKTVMQCLAEKGITLETPDLRKRYLAEVSRFLEVCDQVGLQMLATGIGSDDDDVDGNDESDDNERRWWREDKYIKLDKESEPSNVVIDVFFETDKAERENDNASFTTGFWEKQGVKGKIRASDHDEDDDDPEMEGAPKTEIPAHPYLICFVLRKQMRLKIHVSQMVEYKYDTTLGDKLVLPKENRKLIETLMEYGKGFRDVVKGKGSGSVVLCAGPPGTGKTLTAEVFSEVAEKPLYSVQCSQLGTASDELEDKLLKTFARAQRWGAVLLLDEADVYVRQRGNDIQQNAIVGVFLRTMEYFNGMMFMTTNKEDDVDDAVSSRCVAKVVYGAPTDSDRLKIWEVLNKVSGAKMTAAEILKVNKDHPGLSGRDVKNLLKLAIMSSAGKPVTAEEIKYVKRFKPTKDIQ